MPPGATQRDVPGEEMGARCSVLKPDPLPRAQPRAQAPRPNPRPGGGTAAAAGTAGASPSCAQTGGASVLLFYPLGFESPRARCNKPPLGAEQVPGISPPVFVKHQNFHFTAPITPSRAGAPPGWAQPRSGPRAGGAPAACARVPNGINQPPVGELLNYGVRPRNARANNDNGVNHRRRPFWPRGRENSLGEAGVGLREPTP